MSIISPRCTLNPRTTSPRRNARPIYLSFPVILLFLAALLLFISPTTAQTSDNDNQLEAPLVDLTSAIQSYLMVEDWLAKGAVPDNIAHENPIYTTALFGIRITLRQDGLKVAEGTVYSQDVGAFVDIPGPAVNLTALTADAARLSLHNLDEHLIDARINALAKGLITSEEKQRTITDIAPNLQIDIQLAYNLTSVNLAGQDMPKAIYYNFAPGYHGLRLTNPARAINPQSKHPYGAFIWPATAIAQNMLPPSQVNRLIADLNLKLTDIPQIGQPNGLTFERFDVIHYVKPQADLQPVQLIRGNKLLPPHGIGDQEVLQIAQNLSDHIATQFAPDNRFFGTYSPTNNNYKPNYATPQQTLLTTYSVLRHQRFLETTGQTQPSTDNTADQASSIAEEIAESLINPSKPAKAVELSLALMNIIESPRTTVLGPLRSALANRLFTLQNEDGSFRTASNPEAKPVSQGAQALITAALATLHHRSPQQDLRPRVIGSLNVVWKLIADNPDIASAYWIALAHTYAADLFDASDNPKMRVAFSERQQVLGKLIEQLQSKQIIELPKNGPADIVGGFQLQTIPTGAIQNPSWHSAQVLALLSVGLREPGIKANHDGFGWILTASLAARFLDQLSFNDDSCYYTLSPDKVLGGTRQTLFDNRLPLTSSAMSLLATTELLETLEKLKTSRIP
ncbi:hypothetical protein [Poriferisphaera sp. WC338]|uniref:hypothetical protein n=1 Tax=Poriferisphaera sp. WC338 TaxID=3425129 RepID=UPI003D814010